MGGTNDFEWVADPSTPRPAATYGDETTDAGAAAPVTSPAAPAAQPSAYRLRSVAESQVISPNERSSDRREQIMAAAAQLVARRGFHAVGMGDIGAAAGITGPAIYRHFKNKAAVLTTLFDLVIDGLLDGVEAVLAESPGGEQALTGLIAGQLDFSVGHRELLVIYLQEIHNLPEEDRRRLRRKQRTYLEEWVGVVGELRPELTDVEVRTVVHAAIGVLHSAAYYDSGLGTERTAEMLTSMAYASLRAPVT